MSGKIQYKDKKDIFYNHWQQVKEECNECGAFSECEACKSAYIVYLQASMQAMTGTVNVERANKRAKQYWEYKNE